MKDEDEENTNPENEDLNSEDHSIDENQDEESDEIIKVDPSI